MVIEVKDLSISFGSTKVLNHISLDIAGGAVGLLGPNGAGKSTLIKTLLGFLTPDTGSATVLDMDVRTGTIDIRQQVGYMPENECHIPGMNAVSFVAYAGELCGMPASDAMQRAHEVLYYVGLEEARYRLVETYSAGMKQRIKLAQALVHDPKLLFLDEPTNAMDPSGRQEMLDLIKDISTHKNIHIIFSSHLLPDVEYVCRDIVALHHGNVIVQGNIEALKDSNRQAYELKIKGDREAYLAALGRHGCRWQPTEQSSLRVILPELMDSNVFFRLALETGVQIRHLKSIRQSLEDIFAEAVGEA
ncbi:MAG: ABC transporter ATP-binding protein [Candidatus Poribacteria bacterium]|nr:ABC transporter ATP-binding protein [Candidatus Poribacteria bacterium]